MLSTGAVSPRSSSPVCEALDARSSPEQIRAALINAGVLPTPQEAKATFWSLGTNWWKQIIDGRQHKHGSMVFDEGLHGGPVEPGYLKGVEAACHYFADNFDKPFSLEMYKEIHHRACAHFKNFRRVNSNSGVCCDAYTVDHFRSNGTNCSGYPMGAKGFVEVEKTRLVFQKACKIIKQSQPGGVRKGLEKMIKKQWALEVPPAFDLLHKLTNSQYVDRKPEELNLILASKYEELTQSQKAIAAREIKSMNEMFEQIAKRLGLDEPFVDCWFNAAFDITFSTFYLGANRSRCFETITQKLIEEFNRNLNEAQKGAYLALSKGLGVETIKSDYQEVVIRLVGQLYAELEWLHPWIDGQGRTDLIKLNGLLSREGLHPCILDFPYMSTSSSIERWIEYLKEGLAQFKLAQAVC